MSSVDEMLDLAVEADREPVWDSVWLGDSIFAKPRLDAFVALGAVAARTQRLKLGVGCMASTPLRDALLMAYQWLSFDFLSGGRSIFVACQGQREAGGGRFEEEFAAFGIDPGTRSKRMEEGIEIIRLVSETENASYKGTYNRFEDVTVLPRPVQQPLPIWITGHTNPAFPKMAERILRRIARLGDGWMTTANTPQQLATTLATLERYREEEGRHPRNSFEACLYYNIHVTEDPALGMEEVASYMRDYYSTEYNQGFLDRWVAIGDPQECISRIRQYVDAGATTITLRLVGYDEARQFRRVTDEVLPALVE